MLSRKQRHVGYLALGASGVAWSLLCAQWWAVLLNSVVFALHVRLAARMWDEL